MSYYPKKGVRVPLGTLVEYWITPTPPPPPPPPPPVKRIGSRTYGSLAGDTLSEEEWRDRMLAEQTLVRQWQEHWVKRDELQRWMQLGATLSIPLAAAIWKWILGRRKGESL